MRDWQPRLNLAVCLAMVSFALCSCAPMASLPPMTVTDATHRNDFGGSGTFSVANRSTRVAYERSASRGPDGQVWYSRRAGHFDFGGMVHGGSFSIFGVGAFGRWRFIDREEVRVGVQLAGGLVWYQMGLPMAMQVHDLVWVYTAPSVGLIVAAPWRLPVGVTVALDETFRLHIEGQVGGGNAECLAGDANCAQGGNKAPFDGPVVYSGTVGVSMRP